MRNQKLIRKLELAPESDDSNYTIFLKELVMKYTFNEIFYKFIPIIEDKNISINIRFSAYYACSIFFRRNSKFEEMINLADKYSQYFDQYSLNDVVLSFKYRYLALDYHSKDLMYTAIAYAKSANNKIEHHKAILHHLSETIVTALEYEFIEENDKLNFTQEAITSILESIELWNNEPKCQKYAKNYATLGRLYLQKGDYDKGSSYISKSLNYEEGDTVDSLKRIIKYNNYLYDAQYKKSISNLHTQSEKANKELTLKIQNYENKINDITKELENSKARFIEFLAFFSSIIAIITCTTSLIANSYNFYIAVSLILVLGGVIIFSFGIFFFLFENKYQTRSNYKIVIILSVCIIFAGIYLGMLQNKV